MEACETVAGATTPAKDYLAHRMAGRHPDLPETTAGTIRLDMAENGCTDHWYLTLADQHVRVTRSAEEAELVIRADREVFDDIAIGRARIGAALMRNDLTVQGHLPLLMTLRRLFPGPADARHPRDVARGGGDRR